MSSVELCSDARFAVCLLATMAEIVSRAGEIEWPFFILHGTHDKLCKLEGSEYLYQKAASKDKLLKVRGEICARIYFWDYFKI